MTRILRQRSGTGPADRDRLERGAPHCCTIIGKSYRRVNTADEQQSGAVAAPGGEDSEEAVGGGIECINMF